MEFSISSQTVGLRTRNQVWHEPRNFAAPSARAPQVDKNDGYNNQPYDDVVQCPDMELCCPFKDVSSVEVPRRGAWVLRTCAV